MVIFTDKENGNCIIALDGGRYETTSFCAYLGSKYKTFTSLSDALSYLGYKVIKLERK
jgi:uncharacterized HAD superfamily protein